MARIAGVDLPREKRVEIGLTYIYGIGLTTSQKMLAEVGVNPDTRVKDLSFVIVMVFPSAGRIPSRMPVPARAPRRPLPARRKLRSKFTAFTESIPA